MKTLFIFCFSLSILFCAEHPQEDYPKTYAQLGTPLFQQAENFHILAEMPFFPDQDPIFKAYLDSIPTVIGHGHLVDALGVNNAEEAKTYLYELRTLQKLHDALEKSYKIQLYKSIENNDETKFYKLTSVLLPFISSDLRMKESVVRYYKKIKQNNPTSLLAKETLAKLDHLSRDFSLDQKSYAHANAMFRTSQTNLQVEEVSTLKQFIPNAYLKKSIQVLSVKTKSGYDLYLENNAFYDVTIELKAVKLINLTSSRKLPLVGSFRAQSRTKLVSFSIQDPYKSTLFQTLYNTTIGRLIPDYDENYLYALPYARGSAYKLTQGFNGDHTHKGSSAYALDFKMDEGTPVHAMRDGVVASIEDTHTEHGYSPEFSDKSNHIIIQHDDGTMAMYGHLQKNGVKVKLGQKVYKHAFIGLSGNTGYSSGPHLHVHISAIKDLASGANSVPFGFLSREGKIYTPQEDFFYTAQ